MGKRIITLGKWNDKPIEWFVLKKEKFGTLVISRYALFSLDCRNNGNTVMDWEYSVLREYLNKEFYSKASEADIIIYNSSIASELYTMSQFYDLSNVLPSFKASKNGDVWCTSKSMYQETDKMGSIIEDMHKIITGQAGDGEGLNYIHKLK